MFRDLSNQIVFLCPRDDSQGAIWFTPVLSVFPSVYPLKKGFDVYDGAFLCFFSPRGVLDEILNLIESVSEGFPSYFCIVIAYPSAINLKLCIVVTDTLKMYTGFC